MPAVKCIERLDLEQNISFLDKHYSQNAGAVGGFSVTQESRIARAGSREAALRAG
jgi:hypothetical protein